MPVEPQPRQMAHAAGLTLPTVFGNLEAHQAREVTGICVSRSPCRPSAVVRCQYQALHATMLFMLLPGAILCCSRGDLPTPESMSSPPVSRTERSRLRGSSALVQNLLGTRARPGLSHEQSSQSIRRQAETDTPPWTTTKDVHSTYERRPDTIAPPFDQMRSTSARRRCKAHPVHQPRSAKFAITDGPFTSEWRVAT